MRHDQLCGAIDLARAAIRRFDIIAADRIRNQVYASGLPLSWFMAEEIGHMIASARAEARRPRVEDLRRIAS